MGNSNVKNARRYGIYVHNQPTKNARRYNENEISTYEPHEQTIKLGTPLTWFGGSKNILKSPNVDVSGGLENYAISDVERKESFDNNSEDNQPTGLKPGLTTEMLDATLGNSLYAVKPATHVPDGNGNYKRVGNDPQTVELFDNLSKPTRLPGVTSESTPEEDAVYVSQYEDEIKALEAARDAALGEDGELAGKYQTMLDEAWYTYQSILDMLDTKYANMMKLLGSEKSTSEQRSAINHAKLLKYLPDQLKSMGLGSLGTSQSAFLKAYNAYNNQLSEAQRAYRNGSIDAQNVYNSGVMSALQNYNSNKNAIASMRASEENSLRNYYGGMISDYRNMDFQEKQAFDTHNRNKELIELDNEAKNRELVFNTIASDLLTGTYETPEEVDARLESAKGIASETQYNLLENYAADAKKAIEDSDLSQYAGRAESVGVKGVNGNKGYENDTVRVTVNSGTKDEETYRIKLGEAVDQESDVYQYAKDKIASDTVFVFGGQLYFKAPNGKVVSVQDKKKYGKLLNYLGA